MKVVIRFFIMVVLMVACENKTYVIYNAVKGRVVSAENQSVIAAKIYVDKFASNAFVLETDNNGCFFVDGKMLPYKYLRKQNQLSYNIHIEKEGYIKKIIYVKKLKGASEKMDTIDLGNIYLEKSGNINKYK